MQSVNAAWTVEERDSVRNLAHNLQVSWHNDSTLSARTFTIGVSTIGGNDVIGANPGAIGSPSSYRYFDESAYVTGLSWERGLSQPIGGISKALANVSLSNTSGRFTPSFMGGSSELYTAVAEPRKPIKISAGFNFGGVDQTIPVFAGILNKSPEIDIANRSARLSAADYIDFFQTKNIDQTAMYTNETTDVVIGGLLSQLGMTTAQYELDTGLNTIPFGIYNNGSKFGSIINSLVEAENGQFYQDEMGIFRFENRQHWTNSPYTTVQRIIRPSQVINAKSPSQDHIINVVEVTSNPRVKANGVTIFTLSGTITLNTGDNDVFLNFDNPVLAANAPSITANSASDGTGSNVSASVSVKNTSLFAQSVKYTITNNSGSTAYITALTIVGRWAIPRYDKPLYTRLQDDSSVTAYQEQVLSINNDYIQTPTDAASIAQTILNDFSDPENILVITIRAIPELQMGDLISYQNIAWRVYKIRSSFDPGVGNVQELTMVQRAPQIYFRIGVSTIEGSDQIAP